MKDFIEEIIYARFDEEDGNALFENSYLLDYLDKKTNSVEKSSKSRGSFANLYALYVLIEDYISLGYLSDKKDYSKYEGMMYSEAFNRMRELPFGEKLQNHALNSRCNDEFKKFFSSNTSEVPIIRNLTNGRYWINENLLTVKIDNNEVVNIATLCIEIIDKYIELKQEGFSGFFDDLKNLTLDTSGDPQIAIDYISTTLEPNSDARIFEIVSFVIIKYHFIQQTVIHNFTSDNSEITEPLMVYKIGRTNANDGGIDYIMKPLGRIFQVTEVLDFKKYFLDIDKLIHYPITFVVKQDISPENALQRIENDAKLKFQDEAILSHYLSCFEEIITIPTLKGMLANNIQKGYLNDMINELITQCIVEYNLD